jgi:hypothetical protein
LTLALLVGMALLMGRRCLDDARASDALADDALCAWLAGDAEGARTLARQAMRRGRAGPWVAWTWRLVSEGEAAPDPTTLPAPGQARWERLRASCGPAPAEGSDRDSALP